MENIVVEVHLPAIDETVEFLLPVDRHICDLLPDMTSQIMAVYNTIEFPPLQELFLCDIDRHLLLNPANTFREVGVQNGAKLTLC